MGEHRPQRREEGQGHRPVCTTQRAELLLEDAAKSQPVHTDTASSRSWRRGPGFSSPRFSVEVPRKMGPSETTV